MWDTISDYHSPAWIYYGSGHTFQWRNSHSDQSLQIYHITDAPYHVDYKSSQSFYMTNKIKPVSIEHSVTCSNICYMWQPLGLDLPIRWWP